MRTTLSALRRWLRKKSGNVGVIQDEILGDSSQKSFGFHHFLSRSVQLGRRAESLAILVFHFRRLIMFWAQFIKVLMMDMILPSSSLVSLLLFFCMWAKRCFWINISVANVLLVLFGAVLMAYF